MQAYGADRSNQRYGHPCERVMARAVRHGHRSLMAGPEDTFIGYGRGWANVSNLPFREYKHFAHEAVLLRL